MKIPGVFLCLCTSFLLPVGAFAECGLAGGESFKVVSVTDGDTLKLQDGRSVRVLGINAPEITHGKKAGQPFGRESRAQAQAFIAAANSEIRLGFEREARDHYGRWLAHVYDNLGHSLAAAQVRAGMALQVAVPPNGAQAPCLQDAEQEARQKTRGVWRNSYWQPLPTLSLSGDEAGFRLVRGRITRVDINSAIWLEFEGKLVARVAKKDWSLFAHQKSDWLALKGKEIEVRGWINPRKQKTEKNSQGARQFKPLVMQLRSPSSMRLISR